jgi:hypothetical protein
VVWGRGPGPAGPGTQRAGPPVRIRPVETQTHSALLVINRLLYSKHLLADEHASFIEFRVSGHGEGRDSRARGPARRPAPSWQNPFPTNSESGSSWFRLTVIQNHGCGDSTVIVILRRSPSRGGPVTARGHQGGQACLTGYHQSVKALKCRGLQVYRD